MSELNVLPTSAPATEQIKDVALCLLDLICTQHGWQTHEQAMEYLLYELSPEGTLQRVQRALRQYAQQSRMPIAFVDDLRA